MNKGATAIGHKVDEVCLGSDSGSAMKRDDRFETNIQHKFKEHGDGLVMGVEGRRKFLI